ncbi:hypothetical protein V5N11_027232 [Cardamine amara subsp. amara]|uniref:RNase H type-1 domain-containing protein n=1 Tax=Cardamine amara subsp. amara TaxID=228776 RepID=A0ABD1AIQ9_CARAN
MAGFGWTISTAETKLGQGFAAAEKVRSPFMAEAMAVFQTLQRAEEMNITTLTLASDSQKLIKALNQDIHLMEIHGIQHDILDLSSTFISCIFRLHSKKSQQGCRCFGKSCFEKPCNRAGLVGLMKNGL